MKEAYKVVDTDSGPTIAQLSIPEDAKVVNPNSGDSRIRVDKVKTLKLENLEKSGWGPVDRQTEYKWGQTTKAPEINDDEEVISGPGLHAFKDMSDAKSWMESADIS